MTTTIKVTSHNYPALVQTFDLTYNGEDQPYEMKMILEQVLKPEDGEQQFYCTTSRQLLITDIEYEDKRAVK